MRKPVQKIPYTKGEEIFSAVTHMAGGGLAVAGTAILIVFTAIFGDMLALAASIIYGVSMILLYTMSSLYHMLRPDKAKKFFRIMDHDTIFLLIAGTYTPYTLLAVGGTAGTVHFCFIWLAAIVGIILNSIDLERFKIPSLICYIVMGWSVIFTIKPLLETLSTFEFVFLLIGGIAYTGGIFFYAIKKIKFFHSIWHIFVLLGTVFQYFSVLSLIFSRN